MATLEAAIPETPERRIFTQSEKVCLQKLIFKYKLNCMSGLKSKDTAVKRSAWSRITQEFNSIATNSFRTTAQLKKCWDNIKARRKQALRQRLTSGPVNVSYLASNSSELNDDVDPLVPVKNEHYDNNNSNNSEHNDSNGHNEKNGHSDISWDDDKDKQNSEILDEVVVADIENEVMVADIEDNDFGSVAVEPPHQYVLHLPVNGASQPLKGANTNTRSEQREEELHKFKKAEKIWLLKTLKEQHRKAQLDREKAQLERDKAQIERDKAQLERDKAKLERDKAQVELNQAMREEDNR